MVEIDNILEFIHLVKSHPILWNKKHLFYRTNMKADAYIKIGKKMNVSGEMVKRKIHSLRAAYNKEKRKMKAMGNLSSSGENEQYTPLFKWFHELSFLDSVCSEENTGHNPIVDDYERKRTHEEAGSSDDSNATDNKKKCTDKQEAPILEFVNQRFHVKRYVVQIPKSLLPIKTADAQQLKQRYISLAIPSDFFLANIKWSDTFTPENPFSIKRPCQFHIMHDKVEPPIGDTHLLEPADASCLYSAKVMLLALPPIYEIYQNCFENSADKTHSAIHPWRLINFLVGVEGGVETMAIGGPWSAALDGASPDKDPAVLIRTAIRTCKALTGIDLSSCTQWHRFVEIYYHRQDVKDVDDYVETVVIYLPDIHSLMPNPEEWQLLFQLYKNTNNVDGIEKNGDSIRNNHAAVENSVHKGTGNKAKASIVGEAHDEDSSVDDEDTVSKRPNDKHGRKPSVSGQTGKSSFPVSPHIIVRPNRQAKGGKFDCVVKSMTVLLDYHPDNFKETSFEISLFAELFNDMLMRDFGFKIFKEISSLKETEPATNEITVEKDNMVGIVEEEFIDDDVEKKPSQLFDGCKDEEKQTLNALQAIELQTSSDLGIDKNIINPELLLSFTYFDTSMCGYIIAKDLEDLFDIIGLNMPRSEITKVLKKLNISDSSEPLHYRKLTHMLEPLESELDIEVVNMADLESSDEEADSDNDSNYITSSEDSADPSASGIPSKYTEKEIALALIDEYSKLPQLLKTTMEEIYNCKRKQEKKIYKILANNLNAKLQLMLSVNLVKRKLTFLCNLYEKELERRMTEDVEANAASQWLYSKMGFLEPLVKSKLKLKMSNTKYLQKPLDDHLLYDLIDIYKKYRVLWDTDHLSFFDREKRDEIMVTLAGEIKTNMNISLDVQQLQRQLNYIHKSYSKDKRRRIECEVTEKDFQPTFACFYKCHFLENYQGPFKCSECNLITETHCQHKRHKSEHGGLKCSECGKEYKVDRSLRRHIKKHFKKQFRVCKYRCKYCPDRFVSKHQLDLHLTSHERLCNICGEKFPNEQPFQIHLKMHEEKHKYFCHICQEGFFLKISLSNHIKRHVDKVCDVCKKTFYNSIYLYRHKERVHGKQMDKNKYK